MVIVRVSRQLRQSASKNGDGEVKPGAVHSFSGMYLTAEEKPWKPQLRDRLMKAERPAIASNEVFDLQISVGSHSKS